MKSFVFFVAVLLISSNNLCAQEFEESDAPDPEKLAFVAYQELTKAAMEKCDSAKKLLEEVDVDKKVAAKNKKIVKKLYEGAVDDYIDAVEMNPKSYVAYYNLGINLSKLKKYKKAIIAYSQAALLDTAKNDPYRERAMAWIGRKKFDKALADLDTAVDKNYDDYVAFFQRGLLKETGKNKAPALRDFDRVIELKPDHSQALLHRALISFNDKKDYIYAHHDIMRAYAVDSTNMEIIFWKGKIKFYTNDFSGSNEAFTVYLNGDDSLNVDALVTRGAARVNLERYTDALGDFNSAIERDKKNYYAYMNRGLAKAGLRQFNEALIDMNKAAELKFDFSPIYINRALVKFNLRDKDGACLDLKKAASLNNIRADGLLDKYCPK